MVVRRTIHKLRQRPEDERAAFATAVAIGVAFLLFIGWAAYFLSSLGTALPTAPAQEAQQTASSSDDETGASDQLQLQQVQEATSDPYQITTTSWGN